MAIREALLAVLASGDRHGYQLKTDFETATGGAWTLNVGQVYTTLDRLVRDGLVEVSDNDSSKVYGITAAGRDQLDSWWHPAPLDEAPPRDELMVKILTALHRGPEHALVVITTHRTALTELLQQRRLQQRASTDGTLSEQLVIDALMFRAEADLRWLDQCEHRLRQTSGRTTDSDTTSPRRKHST